jgi:hypothetical protein
MWQPEVTFGHTHTRDNLGAETNGSQFLATVTIPPLKPPGESV